MSTKNASLFLAGGALITALALFGSIPYFLARETAAQERRAAAKREAAKPAPTWTVSVLGGKIVFNDVAKQSREFMEYDDTIALTPAQEAIKAEVLKVMPAACCSGSSAYTCCCPCNLSKTIWGLSNYAIVKHGANAAQLREAVNGWTAFTNPKGYRGNACYRGGCSGAFQTDGCGGMDEDQLVL